MSFKFLKVTRKKLIELLKIKQVSVKKGLTRKQLLEMLKYYDYFDLQKLAQITGVNVTDDIDFDDLEEKLITNVNLKKAHKELLSTYSNKIDNIRKNIDYLERRRYLKFEQDKISNALKLLRQKKLVKRS